MIKIWNILFFCGMLVMNYLANALPLNGKTTGELSDQFPNLFVPAGVTFSIWGVIYLLLIAFCILQYRESNHAVVANIGWFFSLSCLFNGLWIVFWHYGKVPFSVIVMLGLLVTLVYINFLIKDVPAGLIKVTFGIYLGWICIATIANITALFVHYGWSGSVIAAEVWTILLIITGAVISILAMGKLNNPFIGLAVVWAFAGIIIKRQADYRSIVMAAGISAAVVAILMVWALARRKAQGIG